MQLWSLHTVLINFYHKRFFPIKNEHTPYLLQLLLAHNPFRLPSELIIFTRLKKQYSKDYEIIKFIWAPKCEADDSLIKAH